MDQVSGDERTVNKQTNKSNYNNNKKQGPEAEDCWPRNRRARMQSGVKGAEGRSALYHSAHLFVDCGLPPDYESQVFVSLGTMSDHGI